MWNLIYGTNELYKTESLIDTKDRLVVAKEELRWVWKDWEFVVSRCKLLHIQWINSEVLQYSAGSNTQYPGVNYKGKEYKKEWIYVYN